MEKSKPVPYPNLVESIHALADMHVAVHDTVRAHAADHVQGVAAKRKALELKHAAKKLLEGK